MKNKRKNRFIKIICIVLVSCVAFGLVDLGLCGLTDLIAYKDAKQDDKAWNMVMEKFDRGESLTDEDYGIILSQSGLGKPAFDNLMADGRRKKVESYREYYLLDKDYVCRRKGFLACHETITDSDGNEITNPPFADIQTGDIVVTLSIHSYGWRHGHAVIVTDDYNKIGVQAVMVGIESGLTYVPSLNTFPMVAVLRVKDIDDAKREEVAKFAEESLVGLDYSLLAGIFTGKNGDVVPTSTQCAHLVWYAYYHCGIDISPEDGLIITPKDFLKSDKLEVVQVYGSILEV